MQLPTSLRAYNTPTLVLVCDRAQANLYLANDREVLAMDRLTNDRAKLDDKERYVTTVAGTTHFSKAQDETLKDREAKAFYHRIAQTVFDRFQERAFDELIVVVPRNDKNLLLDALPTDVRTAVVHTIAKQLTKLPDDQLFATIDVARLLH